MLLPMLTLTSMVSSFGVDVQLDVDVDVVVDFEDAKPLMVMLKLTSLSVKLFSTLIDVTSMLLLILMLMSVC